MTGEELAELIYQWAENKKMHTDDFYVLFVEELMELMDNDKEVFK